MTEKIIWAFALEDHGCAQLTPVDNLPFIWTGPTAEFDIDPTTVRDCWWELIHVPNLKTDHYTYKYHKEWDDAKQTGNSIYDDDLLFFTSDEQMQRFWQENQLLPKSRTALYQDWYYYKSEDNSK